MLKRSIYTLIGLLAASTMACSSDAPSTSDPSQVGETCRNYMTAGAVTFDGVSTDMVCSFDEAKLVNECVFEVEGEEMVVGTIYAELEDFIAEAKIVGLVRALSEYLQEPGSARKTTTNTYDDDGQLTMQVEDRSEGTLTTTFDSHDSSGRPLTGEMTWATCDSLPIELAYDDDKRTVTKTFKPVGSQDCGFNARSDIDYYDADGNLVSVEEEGGAVFETTVTQSATVCM